VHLKLAFDWSLKPAYNVIARLQGSTYPNEWIVRGNHHDAWVNGAQDPVSGVSAELEEARALGVLKSQGWKPKRTIIYAAWDGEEPGLLGSTEWVEAHGDELRDHAVAYLNSDTNARGYLGVAGSHSLEKFINGVGRDVRDPETKLTVNERVKLSRIRTSGVDERKEAREREDLRIEALG
jgi:N-acetylated-alpha-linked acidic dipeptidase